MNRAVVAAAILAVAKALALFVASYDVAAVANPLEVRRDHAAIALCSDDGKASDAALAPAVLFTMAAVVVLVMVVARTLAAENALLVLPLLAPALAATLLRASCAMVGDWLP